MLSLARETLQQLQGGGNPEQPQVVLRKLFERLGATYIKLGQFIASSPTLFPPEYVLEFQKCLDKTPPVPFGTIRQAGPQMEKSGMCAPKAEPQQSRVVLTEYCLLCMDSSMSSTPAS